jgi:hypothetical protein
MILWSDVSVWIQSDLLLAKRIEMRGQRDAGCSGFRLERQTDLTGRRSDLVGLTHPGRTGCVDGWAEAKGRMFLHPGRWLGLWIDEEARQGRVTSVRAVESGR